MLSICIPIYNFDVGPLVKELAEQAGLLEIPSEILLIDDGSDTPFKESNRRVCSSFTYLELEHNIGRAKIRNLFLQHANQPYLLFLDCDSLIPSPHFLKKYVELLPNTPSVVCGGRIYPSKRPSSAKLLRWKYGVLRESQPLHVREKFPNRSFMTNNFLIAKNVFEKVQFEERLSKYGHEDTLFGLALKKEHIVIQHIDNPILNGDLENNKEYLQKTEEGITNLVQMLKFSHFDKGLMEDITLLRFYMKIKPFKSLVRFSFFLLRPLLYFLLSQGIVSLPMFDFYKLGLLCEKVRDLNPIE